MEKRCEYQYMREKKYKYIHTHRHTRTLRANECFLQVGTAAVEVLFEANVFADVVDCVCV